MTCPSCIAAEKCDGPEGDSCREKFSRVLERIGHNDGCQIACGRRPHNEMPEAAVCRACVGEAA